MNGLGCVITLLLNRQSRVLYEYYFSGIQVFLLRSSSGFLIWTIWVWLWWWSFTHLWTWRAEAHQRWAGGSEPDLSVFSWWPSSMLPLQWFHHSWSLINRLTFVVTDTKVHHVNTFFHEGAEHSPQPDRNMNQTSGETSHCGSSPALPSGDVTTDFHLSATAQQRGGASTAQVGLVGVATVLYRSRCVCFNVFACLHRLFRFQGTDRSSQVRSTSVWVLCC